MNTKPAPLYIGMLLAVSILFADCDEIEKNQMVQLTYQDFCNACNPLWYGGDDLILFDGTEFTTYHSGILTIKPDGTGLSLLIDVDQLYGDNYYLCPSDITDDDYLIFDSGAEKIFYYPMSGGEPQFICNGMRPTITGALDGNYNLACYLDENLAPQDPGIYLTDIHNSPLKLIAGFYYFADWSPDGKKLLLCSKYAISVYDTQTEEITDVYYGDFPFSAHYSPDGRWIAFTEYPDGSDKGEVYIMPVEGGTPQKLTEFPYNQDLLAEGASDLYRAPDGTWIVYDLLGEELWKVSVE